MDTVTIPKDEYLELIELYNQITKRINRIKQYQSVDFGEKSINTLKYCGVITLEEDPLTIQNSLRDEWE